MFLPGGPGAPACFLDLKRKAILAGSNGAISFYGRNDPQRRGLLTFRRKLLGTAKLSQPRRTRATGCALRWAQGPIRHGGKGRGCAGVAFEICKRTNPAGSMSSLVVL